MNRIVLGAVNEIKILSENVAEGQQLSLSNLCFNIIET